MDMRDGQPIHPPSNSIAIQGYTLGTSMAGTVGLWVLLLEYRLRCDSQCGRLTKGSAGDYAQKREWAMNWVVRLTLGFIKRCQFVTVPSPRGLASK